MKKARIVLATFGVIAIAAGIFAFKAKNTYSGNLRCTHSPIIPNECPLTAYYTFPPGTLMWCTRIDAPQSATCVLMNVSFHP
jgi:hypothetical protein